MTYKFIFKKEIYQATTTYKVERTYFGDYPVDKIFHDACCLLDTGTHDSLLEASNFISTIQNRQGLQVALSKCKQTLSWILHFSQGINA